MKGKKEKLLSESPLSVAEREWLTEVNKKTVRGMVEWLKAGTDTDLPIKSLKEPALNALAEIARATYIVERQKRRDAIASLPPAEQEAEQLWLI